MLIIIFFSLLNQLIGDPRVNASWRGLMAGTNDDEEYHPAAASPLPGHELYLAGGRKSPRGPNHMISIRSSLLQSLAIIVGLILVSLLLRKKSIISEEERPVFGRLVTDFALSALIFSGLARQSFEMSELDAK
jgi:hypothetical protein